MVKRYIPDLPNFIALGEQNHALIMQLLRNMAEDKFIAFADGGNLSLVVDQTAPYTWFLRIHFARKLLPIDVVFDFNVRVYLDAQLAEVISSAHVGKLEAIFHYPNDVMAHIDEKEQSNLLLNELLIQATQQGMLEDFPVKGLA